MNTPSLELPPDPGLVVINSNLAIPHVPGFPRTLDNPNYAFAPPKERRSFEGAKAFSMPETIELRLFDGSKKPYEDELLEQIRLLGHGVTALVDYHDLSTLVSLGLVDRARGKPGRPYLGWNVIGFAAIPKLGVERVQISAKRIAGHHIGARATSSRVRLLGNPIRSSASA